MIILRVERVQMGLLVLLLNCLMELLVMTNSYHYKSIVTAPTSKQRPSMSLKCPPAPQLNYGSDLQHLPTSAVSYNFTQTDLNINSSIST